MMEKMYSGLIGDSPDNQQTSNAFDALYELTATEDYDMGNKIYVAICEYGYAEKMQAFQRGLAIGMELANMKSEYFLSQN